MEDGDVITFGKHKGKKLQDVPADYLLWLADQPGFDESKPDLYDYIDRNRAVLEAELEGRVR